MKIDFYRAFEDKFRGSRDLIKSRLQVFLPFVLPLQNHCPNRQIVDLGCGRGEWLELLAENGFSTQGVDLDDGMLSACRDRGLKVQAGDALTFLTNLPDASQVVVSGFHIAEHLPFETLQELVDEALRVLVPGGLLILETPNPENLVVGTSSFYLDPTHQKPIPPPLLIFLLEYAGFKHSKILRLQESPELVHASKIVLLGVLGGVSPDYAVVAQKDGPKALLDALHDPLNTEYGVTLSSLADKYQQQTDACAQELADMKVQQVATENRAQVAEAQAEKAVAEAQAEKAVAEAQAEKVVAESRAQVAEAQAEKAVAEAQAEKAVAEAQAAKAHLLAAQLAATQKELHDIHQSNHHHWQQWEATKQELHAVHQSNHHHWQLAEARQQALQAIQSSWSWRITAPLRWIAAPVMQPGGTRAVTPVLTFSDRAIRWGMAQPRLVAAVHRAVARYPGLRAAITRRVASAMPSAQNFPIPSSCDAPPQAAIPELSNLTPRARQIYADLKSALARRQQENG